jgi:fumarate reductase subunit C
MIQQEVIVNRAYKKKMPILWWTKRRSHIHFITRELTSLSVGIFAIVLLFLIRALSKGPEAYAAYLEALQSPIMIILHLIAFAGLIFHSITWFNLAPKAMVVKMGKDRVPDTLIILSNYIGWIIISGFIMWYLIY